LPGRFPGPTLDQALLSGPSVILPDESQTSTLYRPNARPLSSVVSGKCKLNQMDAVAARLMHNHLSGDPTRSRLASQYVPLSITKSSLASVGRTASNDVSERAVAAVHESVYGRCC
jgi:hypothetical protein